MRRLLSGKMFVLGVSVVVCADPNSLVCLMMSELVRLVRWGLVWQSDDKCSCLADVCGVGET